MQLPPTPMPMNRPESAPISVDISLWDSASTAINFWNLLPEATIMFQFIMTLFIVGLCVMVFINIINNIVTTE